MFIINNFNIMFLIVVFFYLKLYGDDMWFWEFFYLVIVLNYEFYLFFFEELNLKMIRGNLKFYFCGKYVEEIVVK